jgi:hypothetical protein
MIACLPVFGKGVFEVTRGSPAAQSQVADAADVAEVPVRDYVPRRDPRTQRASGQVYALPATPLSPEPERLPPPVYAISGVKGQEIHEDTPWIVDVLIDLPENETFSRGLLEGEDVSSWIQNLPAGLEAKAHKIKKGDRSIKIYVSGVPEVTMREIIRVGIPGTYLTSGTARSFVSPSQDASFAAWQAGQTE